MKKYIIISEYKIETFIFTNYYNWINKQEKAGQKGLFFARVISSVGLERCFDRAEVTGSNPVSPTTRERAVRDVAQPGRVHVWGACGRRFKSCHPDPNTAQVSVNQVLGFFYFREWDRFWDRILAFQIQG